MAEEEKKTKKLDKNLMGALAYVLGPVTGVVVYLMEKDPFVRFHAKQSIVVFGALFIIEWIMGMTIILIPVVPIVSLLGLVLWIVLIFKAYKGIQWEVPYIGKYIGKIFSKLESK